MEENNEVVEQEAVDLGGFDLDAAWNEDDDYVFEASESSETPDAGDEDEDQEGQPDDADEAVEEEEPEEQTEEQGDKGEEGNQLFTINFLGNEEKLTLEQMTELAQKGRNYDHVTSERDTLKGENGRMKSFLQKMADKAGVSIEEQMDLTEAMWLMDEEAAKGNTLTESEALLRVQRSKTSKPEKEAEDRQKSEQNKIIDRFLAVYPDVKATDIPKDVWDTASRTGDLLGAYQAFEIKRLKEENEKIRKDAQNERNAQRSTGPLKTSGTKRKRSVIDDAWYADD